MPQQLKSMIVKPYFFIDWDDDTRFKISATKKDIDRFLKDYKGWAKKFENPENVDDLEVCRAGFQFLCGDEVGEQIYQLALDDMRSEDPTLTEGECVYQLLPVITFIAEQWVDHIASMDFERNERVKKYIAQAKAPKSL